MKINTHLMHSEERRFFRICCRQIDYYRLKFDSSTIRFINPMTFAISIGVEQGIPEKMIIGYLIKWSRLGFYDYGTNICYGWFDFDALPSRYIDIIPARVLSKIFTANYVVFNKIRSRAQNKK